MKLHMCCAVLLTYSIFLIDAQEGKKLKDGKDYEHVSSDKAKVGSSIKRSAADQREVCQLLDDAVCNQQLREAVDKDSIDDVKTCLGLGANADMRWAIIPSVTVHSSVKSWYVKSGYDYDNINCRALLSYVKSVPVAEVLMAHRANVNGSDVPLFWQIKEGRTDVVRLLLEHKAHPSPAVGSLHAAIVYADKHYGKSRESIDIVTCLIAHKADVNAKNIYGMTPIYVAAAHPCRYNDEEIVKLLIAHKADVNAQCNDREGPLHVAIGRCNIPRLLIDAKADLNAPSAIGTPLDLLLRR